MLLGTVDRVQARGDKLWVEPFVLGMVPASGSGGTVAPARPLECIEIDSPDHDALLGRDLAMRWRNARDRHRERLTASTSGFNGDLPLVWDLDPGSSKLWWYRSDYASHEASREVANAAGVQLQGLDLAPCMLVLVACAEGWVRSRRSAAVSLPHLWQHAAAELLTLEDLSGVLDHRRPAARALSEEFALDVPRECLHPWLIQCQGEPGRGAGFVSYVVADLREHTLAALGASQRQADDAWEIDAIETAAHPEDWQGLRTLPQLLLPRYVPEAWFATDRSVT